MWWAPLNSPEEAWLVSDRLLFPLQLVIHCVYSLSRANVKQNSLLLLNIIESDSPNTIKWRLQMEAGLEWKTETSLDITRKHLSALYTWTGEQGRQHQPCPRLTGDNFALQVQYCIPNTNAEKNRISLIWKPQFDILSEFITSRKKQPGVCLQSIVSLMSGGYRQEKSFNWSKTSCAGRWCLWDKAACSLTGLKIILPVSLVSCLYYLNDPPRNWWCQRSRDILRYSVISLQLFPNGSASRLHQSRAKCLHHHSLTFYYWWYFVKCWIEFVLAGKKSCVESFPWGRMKWNHPDQPRELSVVFIQ